MKKQVRITYTDYGDFIQLDKVVWEKLKQVLKELKVEVIETRKAEKLK